MTGLFCRSVGCYRTQIEGSKYCTKHTAVSPSLGDLYIGEKYAKYDGKVHLIVNRSFDSLSITRFDMGEQYLIIPLDSPKLSKPDLIDVEEYLKEREEHFHRSRIEDAREKGCICTEQNCDGFRVSGSPYCHDHMPAEEDDEFFEPGSFEGQLGQVLAEMEDLLMKKNKDYGSSYDKTVEELGETVILIRIMDKFNRLKQLIKSGEPAEVEETIEETLSDLVGYGIIELVRRRRS